jgi:hypothetical protein
LNAQAIARFALLLIDFADVFEYFACLAPLRFQQTLRSVYRIHTNKRARVKKPIRLGVPTDFFFSQTASLPSQSLSVFMVMLALIVSELLVS